MGERKIETFQDILDLSKKTGLSIKILFNIFGCPMETVTKANLFVLLKSSIVLDFDDKLDLIKLVKKEVFSEEELRILIDFFDTCQEAFADTLRERLNKFYFSLNLESISDFDILERMRCSVGHKKPEVVTRIIFLIKNLKAKSLLNMEDIKKAKNVGSMNAFGYNEIKKAKEESNFIQKLQKRGRFLHSQFDVEKINSQKELHQIIYDFDDEYCDPKQRKKLIDKHIAISENFLSKITKLSDINKQIYYDMNHYGNVQKRLLLIWVKLIEDSIMTKEKAIKYLEEVSLLKDCLRVAIVKKIISLSWY